MRVTLIHNPQAGNGDHKGKTLRELIRDAGHEVVYQSSKDKDWKKALVQPADLVAVAAGDGTVARVARALVGSGVAIAVLPAGTANNIAATLNLKNTPMEQLIAGWDAGQRIGFDVGIASGPWGSKCFVEALGLGVVAQTIADPGPEDSAHPIASAQRLLLARLPHYPVRELHIAIDGEDLSGRYFLAEAMNTRYVGPNLPLAPAADPGDGLLDLVLAREGDQEILSEYLLASVGEKPMSPPWTVRKAQRLRFLCDGCDVHMDDKAWPGTGETVPRERSVHEITVQHHALTFLIPAAVPT